MIFKHIMTALVNKQQLQYYFNPSRKSKSNKKQRSASIFEMKTLWLKVKHCFGLGCVC